MGAVEVRGLRDFRRDLKAADAAHPKALSAIHREIARRERDSARRRASMGSKLERRAAGGIGSSASATSAKLTVRGTVGAPMAPAAFWGTLKRTGWYARDRYANSPRQHPVWVGSNWQAASPSQGPYVLNVTLHDDLPEIERLLMDRYAALYDQAFPQP